MSKRVLCVLANEGQDPTEVAIPCNMLIEQGYTVDFATENGQPASADPRMLEGLLAKIAGAPAKARQIYYKLADSPAWKTPKSWSDPNFSILEYDGVLLPGGHDKPMRQYLESSSLQAHLVKYFPQTARDSAKPKVVAAICHGVLALARAKGSDGKSVLYNCQTTTLPVYMERSAYFATAPFFGDYYRTYSAYTADEVQSLLRAPDQYIPGAYTASPHVVVDQKHYYVSARFPGDAEVFAQKFIDLLKENK